MTTRLFRFVLVTAGSISVALGVIGMFVPLMPTTVFLLLAAACYARSSERHYQRLLQNRVLGPYIRSSREGRGISRRYKFTTIALLWAGIGATAVWSVDAWWLRGLLLIIAVAVTAHVARLQVAPVAVPETTDARA